MNQNPALTTDISIYTIQLGIFSECDLNNNTIKHAKGECQSMPKENGLKNMETMHLIFFGQNVAFIILQQEVGCWAPRRWIHGYLI